MIKREGSKSIHALCLRIFESFSAIQVRVGNQEVNALVSFAVQPRDPALVELAHRQMAVNSLEPGLRLLSQMLLAGGAIGSRPFVCGAWSKMRSIS